MRRASGRKVHPTAGCTFVALPWPRNCLHDFYREAREKRAAMASARAATSIRRSPN
jgi:hypothetical protein